MRFKVHCSVGEAGGPGAPGEQPQEALPLALGESGSSVGMRAGVELPIAAVPPARPPATHHRRGDAQPVGNFGLGEGAGPKPGGGLEPPLFQLGRGELVRIPWRRHTKLPRQIGP
jgi:hypothetical protein